MDEIGSLVERSRSGDLEAFAEIVRRFQDMAHGYAYSVLGDFHDAEDAAQEAFIQAYLKLPGLRDARAFPGWFRRIVLRRCLLMRRRERAGTVSLEEAGELPANQAGLASRQPDPAQAAERREMQEKVLEAVRALPEGQRAVTTLFYIDGYSQEEIAGFLEVPVTTVKKRLHDSRRKLKERMMDMIEDTLKRNTPDERFSRKVITELLARPKLLEIKGHPVRQVAETIRAALPEFEWVDGEEVVEKSGLRVPIEKPDQAFHLGKDRILRTQTTETILRAAAGRKPPARLVTAGRVFRPDREDARHRRVFHQLDVLCVEEGADVGLMKATIQRVLEAVFGSPVEVRWRRAHFPTFERCYEALVKLRGRWNEVAGCGMLAEGELRRNGFDPARVGGFGFGLGLEWLAMHKLGIDQIGKLWQPPYVPKA